MSERIYTAAEARAEELEEAGANPPSPRRSALFNATVVLFGHRRVSSQGVP